MPGGVSRWNAGKDLTWEPLRTELVAEVRYEHVLSGGSATAVASCASAPTARPTAAPTRSSTRSPPPSSRDIFL